MAAPLITLDELKTYLGITGTTNDALLASIASNISAKAERDTGRTFSVTSNTTYRYSTDGQSSLIIHDRPYDDATRTVTLSGVTMREGTNVWFLPDRRNPDATCTIQLELFGRESGWWLAHSNWFDANLDSPYYRLGAPNDLVITGTVGHPAITGDVRLALLEAGGFYFYRAKGGASSYAKVLSGEDVDLTLLPQAYQDFVHNWKIRTAVAVVG